MVFITSRRPAILLALGSIQAFVEVPVGGRIHRVGVDGALGRQPAQVTVAAVLLVARVAVAARVSVCLGVLVAEGVAPGVGAALSGAGGQR